MSASRFPGVPSSDRLLTQPEPLLGPGEGLGNRRPTIDGSMTWPEDACIARDIDIGALRMMYRRSFIGLIAGAVVVGATRGSNARSDRIGDIGVQLYTLRHEMQRDFEGTLARIAEIGYREAQGRHGAVGRPTAACPVRRRWRQPLPTQGAPRQRLADRMLNTARRFRFGIGRTRCRRPLSVACEPSLWLSVPRLRGKPFLAINL